ncbi:MAG: alpha/beta hydrolase [Myxococcaceae bacterium]|nr:alpha/beta hydrolase [Myxococcaceae bacterium]
MKFLAMALMLWGGNSVAAPKVKTGDLQVSGFTLHYQTQGRGPPLLLIHGGGSDLHRFDTLAPMLAKFFTVITPDCRGRGRSSDVDAPFTYEAMADDMLALLDALGHPRAHVVGWSDGGVVALQLAMQHPGRVDRIATFGANARPEGLTPAMQKWVAEVTPEEWKNDDYAKNALNPSHWPVVVEKLKTMWTTLPTFTNEALSKITAPALIAAGDNDDIRLEHTVEIAALFRMRNCSSCRARSTR